MMQQIDKETIVLTDGVDSLDDLRDDFSKHLSGLSVQLFEGSVFIRQHREGPIIVELKELQQIVNWLAAKGIIKLEEVFDGK